MIVRSIALFLVCGVSIAEDAALMPATEVIKIMQIEVVKPLFEYCQAAVPEMAMEVSSEFESFHGKFDEAMNRFLEHIPASELGSASATDVEEVRKTVAGYGRAQVENVKQRDPRVFCPRVVTNARNTTVEALQARIEAAYAEYQERVKAKREAAQQ